MINHFNCTISGKREDINCINTNGATGLSCRIARAGQWLQPGSCFRSALNLFPKWIRISYGRHLMKQGILCLCLLRIKYRLHEWWGEWTNNMIVNIHFCIVEYRKKKKFLPSPYTFINFSLCSYQYRFRCFWSLVFGLYRWTRQYCRWRSLCARTLRSPILRGPWEIPSPCWKNRVLVAHPDRGTVEVQNQEIRKQRPSFRCGCFGFNHQFAFLTTSTIASSLLVEPEVIFLRSQLLILQKSQSCRLVMFAMRVAGYDRCFV